MKFSDKEKAVLLRLYGQLNKHNKNVDAEAVKNEMITRDRFIETQFLTLVDKLSKNNLITWPYQSNMLNSIINSPDYPKIYELLMHAQLSQEYQDYYYKSLEHGLFFTDELMEMCEKNFSEEGNRITQVLEKVTKGQTLQTEATKDIANAIKNQTETQHSDSIHNTETLKQGTETISAAIEDAHKEPKWKIYWKWFKEFAGIIAIVVQIIVLIIQCNSNKNDREKLEKRIDAIEINISTMGKK